MQCHIKITGTGGCWCWAADTDGFRTWWFCYEVCSWSEWEPRDPEVHRVCPSRSNSFYYIIVFWTSCGFINAPVWVPCHSGLYRLFFLITLMTSIAINHILLRLLLQRVLEHCDDPEMQNIIMDEIMQSVCTLVQDQYGNYVIQVFQFFLELNSIFSHLCGFIVDVTAFGNI